jgi:hypothetical protein
MDAIYATPFIPGTARGPLHTPDDSSDQVLVMLGYDQVAGFDGPAAGLVVVGAAPLSHPMLRLSLLNVPTVLITPEQAARLDTGEEYVLDGTYGVLTDPDSWRKARTGDLTAGIPEPGEPVHTRDGVALELRASVTGPEGARQAVRFGAAGIGMVRSEYMMPEDVSQPAVDFYRRAFLELCEAADGLPVTLRLLDLAPDKVPDWLPEVAGMRGLLALRGSRLYDTPPIREVFLAQAQAAGELCREYPLRVMLPYLVQAREYRRWRADIAAVAPEELAVGVMAETPGAALAIDEVVRDDAVAKTNVRGEVNEHVRELLEDDPEALEPGERVGPRPETVAESLDPAEEPAEPPASEADSEAPGDDTREAGTPTPGATTAEETDASPMEDMAAPAEASPEPDPTESNADADDQVTMEDFL